MQPTIIEDNIAVAANSVNENVIVSNASLRGLLQAPYRCRIRLLAVATVSIGFRIDFSHGAKNTVSSAELRVATSPDDPLDVVNDEMYAEEGEQLQLRAVNTLGASHTLRYRIVMEPWEGEFPGDCLVMQRALSIAAATVDQQLLDGLQYERVSVPSQLQVFMTMSAAGVLRQLYIDQDRIAPPSVFSAANRMPQDPFDMTIDGVEVPPNALQQLQVSNPTGGALFVYWKTKNRQTVRT